MTNNDRSIGVRLLLIPTARMHASAKKQERYEAFFKDRSNSQTSFYAEYSCKNFFTIIRFHFTQWRIT